MDTRAIRQNAHELEQLADCGDIVGFTKQLHNIRIQDRFVVASQIEHDHQNNPSLPVVKLSGSGELQSMDRRIKNGFLAHEEFSFDAKTGNLKAVDEYDVLNGRPTGHKEHTEFFAASGMVKSTDITYADGTWERTGYDPTTHKITSYDKICSDGSEMHVKYDPNVGKPECDDVDGE